MGQVSGSQACRRAGSSLRTPFFVVQSWGLLAGGGGGSHEPPKVDAEFCVYVHFLWRRCQVLSEVLDSEE